MDNLNCCCFILLAALLLLCSAATNITYVDNSNAGNFSDATCNVIDRRCPSIGGALNITANHSSVYIYPGIYRGYNNTDLCIHSKCAYNVSIKGLGDDPSDVVIIGDDETQSGVPYLAFKIDGHTITYMSNLAISNFTTSIEKSFIGTRRELETYGAGAIELYHGSVTFEDVVFTYNDGVGGGCLTALDSDVVFRSCVFSKNRGQLRGAALFGFRSNFSIFDSAFTGNAVKSMQSQPSGIGGAIYLSTARLLFIKGCFFSDNVAELAGGAVYVADLQLGNLQVYDSRFEGNTVNGNGNCIASSSCNSRGGALYASSLNMKISNCSFLDNYVMTQSTTQVHVYLCIVCICVLH
jgi:predicted outer membrane repeat protein